MFKKINVLNLLVLFVMFAYSSALMDPERDSGFGLTAKIPAMVVDLLGESSGRLLGNEANLKPPEGALSKEDVFSILTDETITTVEAFKKALLDKGIPQDDVDILIEEIKCDVENEIYIKLKQAAEGEKRFTLFGKDYEIGFSDVNGELNDILAKIGSEKRLITGSFADQTLIAYGYIIDEKVHEDKRIFVFSDLNGEDEISEIPITLLALTDHLRSVAIFSDYLKRELESWTKLVFNNDLSQAASTHPDLEIAMMKTALSEYGINSIDDINEEKTNLFLKELQESVIMHEMSHFEVYNALGPDFLGLSSVINEGQNVFCLVNETLADIGALKNLIEISKNDEQKANRMAIQWLALRLKALGNPLEVKTIYMQVTTSLLLSFMERDKETGLKVRFTGEHSLEEGIEKLSQMFLDSTKIAKNEVVSYIGSFFAPGEFPDKAMQIYKQTLEQEHPGVEIPEKLIQQGLLPRMYMFLSKERSQACDNIRDYLGTIGTTFIWDGILNNPDIAGEYAGTKEYEFVNLTAYILDKLKDLGF